MCATPQHSLHSKLPFFAPDHLRSAASLWGYMNMHAVHNLLFLDGTPVRHEQAVSAATAAGLSGPGVTGGRSVPRQNSMPELWLSHITGLGIKVRGAAWRGAAQIAQRAV